jgi:hypothetical protein
MKSFLVKDKKPVVRWGLLPDNVFFEGTLPEGYSLAISPSDKYIIIDVDVNDKKNGFNAIPSDILKELNSSLNYPTKNKGSHFWLNYTGEKNLPNKTSGVGIDLRTNKGYVVWYRNDDIRDCMHLIHNTSDTMNMWIESLFSYKKEIG